MSFLCVPEMHSSCHDQFKCKVKKVNTRGDIEMTTLEMFEIKELW